MLCFAVIVALLPSPQGRADIAMSIINKLSYNGFRPSARWVVKVR